MKTTPPPTPTYTRPSTPLEDHIAWCESEGLAVSVSESESLVSVETTTRWGTRDLNIFRKDGKKVSSFDDMKHFLSSFIKKG